MDELTKAGELRTDRTDSYRDWIPVMVSAIVAVAGIAALLLTDFGPVTGSTANGGGMITAAAVSRAGAIVLPTPPAAGLRP